MKKIRKSPLLLYALLVLMGCFMIYRDFTYLLCCFRPQKSLEQIYQGDLHIGDHVSDEISHTYGCFATNEKVLHISKNFSGMNLPFSEEFFYLQYYSEDEGSKIIAVAVGKQDSSTMDMIAERSFSGDSVTFHLKVDGILFEMKETYVPFAKNLLGTYYGESDDILDDIEHFYVIKTFDVTRVFVKAGIGTVLFLIFWVLFIVRLNRISKYKRLKQCGEEITKNVGAKKELTEKDLFDAAGGLEIQDKVYSDEGKDDTEEENVTAEEKDVDNIEDEERKVDEQIVVEDENRKADDPIVVEDENEIENNAVEIEKTLANENVESEYETGVDGACEINDQDDFVIVSLDDE